MKNEHIMNANQCEPDVIQPSLQAAGVGNTEQINSYGKPSPDKAARRKLAPDAVRMEYRIVVTGAGETPVNLDGSVDLAMVVGEGMMNMDAERRFNALFDVLLGHPAKISMRAFFSKRQMASIERMHAEAAQRRAAEARQSAQPQSGPAYPSPQAPPPSHVTNPVDLKGHAEPAFNVPWNSEDAAKDLCRAAA